MKYESSRASFSSPFAISKIGSSTPRAFRTSSAATLMIFALGSKFL